MPSEYGRRLQVIPVIVIAMAPVCEIGEHVEALREQLEGVGLQTAEGTEVAEVRRCNVPI